MRVVILLVMVVGVSLVWAEEQAVTASAPAAAEAAAPAAGVAVEKIAVGTAIENRELIGEAGEFPAGTAKVYCWTKITAGTVPAQVKHVWSVDGKTEAEVALAVNYPAARTWSSKNVWPGAWTVEVKDDAGQVVQSVAFTVK